MTAIRGIYGAVGDAAAAFQNNIEDERRQIWDWAGNTQGILYGFAHTLDVGALTVTFSAGSAIVEQRGTDINGDGAGYHLTAYTNTTVPFDAPSASSRNDALVFAWVDPQYGTPGAGLSAGPQIIVVKGVSGSTTPRTDAQIQAAVNVGGWFRYADVIIAPGNTAVQAGNFTDQHPSVRRHQGPKESIFTASGNFTRSDRPAAVGAWVRAWGAGGGGGAVDGQGGQGESGGGGAGGYSERWYTGAEWAALARTFAVTVGTGGAGGVANVGGTGGATVCDTITCNGGVGGSEMVSTASSGAATGGAGGTASGGDINITGAAGSDGRVLAGAAVFANHGGSAPSGGAGGKFVNFVQAAGAAGVTPGGGGSGCFGTTVDQVGGAGASGRVIITEYF